MLDVLVVEPLEQMAEVYKNMIPWEMYGFSITSVCDTEQQAISYFGEYPYALVICDLRLKRGNGLSLIKKLKELDPGCVIAVISDQDEFRFVHDAFRLGVFDFLQKKTIRASQLTKLLMEVKRQRIQPLEETELDKLEKMLGHVRDHQKIDENDFYNVLDKMNMSMLQADYVMAYVRMDNVRQINRKLKIYDQPDWISEEEYMLLYKNRLKQREELRMNIMKTICDQLQLPSYQLLFIKRHSVIIVFPAKMRSMFMEQAEYLKQEIEHACSAEFSITVSQIIKCSERFLVAFRQLMEGQKRKFYIGDSSIVDLTQDDTWNVLELNSIPIHLQLKQAILSHDGEKTLHILFRMLQFINDNMIAQSNIIQYFVNLFTWMEKTLHEEFDDLSMQKEAVVESETFLFLKYELERIFKTFKDQFEQKHTSQVHHIDKMKEYIEKHLSEKIELQDVAQSADISVVYASRIMKEETGYSLLQYIQKHQMEKAEHLLRDTNWKINKISSAIGYEDALYFSRQFHKWYQVSPREYRKRLQNMDKK